MSNTNEWTEKKIFEKIKIILSEALEVDPEIIKPESLIINDLEAESIDVLDISFRLEKAFKITIPEQSFSSNSQNIPDEKTLGEIFTVQILVDFIKQKLAEARAHASS